MVKCRNCKNLVVVIDRPEYLAHGSKEKIIDCRFCLEWHLNEVIECDSYEKIEDNK